jgi:hypothetical protein
VGGGISAEWAGDVGEMGGSSSVNRASQSGCPASTGSGGFFGICESADGSAKVGSGLGSTGGASIRTVGALNGFGATDAAGFSPGSEAPGFGVWVSGCIGFEGVDKSEDVAAFLIEGLLSKEPECISGCE